MDLSDDTLMGALLSTTGSPSPQPREHPKRPRYRDDKDNQARKRECLEFEGARRASLIYEEARQMRDQEVATGASSSRINDVEKSTTKGDDYFADTTNGVPTTEGAGFGKSDQPSC